MLPSLGFLVGESGAMPLFGGTAINQFRQVPKAFWPLVFLFIAVPEVFCALRGLMEPTAAENSFQLRPDYILGDPDCEYGSFSSPPMMEYGL
jgi:hypothetical protein